MQPTKWTLTNRFQPSTRNFLQISVTFRLFVFVLFSFTKKKAILPPPGSTCIPFKEALRWATQHKIGSIPTHSMCCGLGAVGGGGAKSGDGGVVEWAIQRGRIETREVHRQWIAYGFDLGGYGNCRIGMKLELIAGLWQWRMKYTAFWMRYLRTNRVEWTDWRAGGLAGWRAGGLVGWWAAVGRTIVGGEGGGMGWIFRDGTVPGGGRWEVFTISATNGRTNSHICPPYFTFMKSDGS